MAAAYLLRLQAPLGHHVAVHSRHTEIRMRLYRILFVDMLRMRRQHLFLEASYA